MPVWSSEHFARALKEAGAKVTLDVRKGMTCLDMSTFLGGMKMDEVQHFFSSQVIQSHCGQTCMVGFKRRHHDEYKIKKLKLFAIGTVMQ